MKVIVNAQLDPGTGSGGIEGVVVSLVRALGRLTDGDEHYVIVTNAKHPHWLDEHLGPNQSVATIPPKRKEKQSIRTAVGKELGRGLRRLMPREKPYPHPRLSDGFFESLGADVIHFPYQHFEICSLPTLFNPHDLQHRHFPHFFPLDAWIRRETDFRAGCEMAHTVIVSSQWVKDDLILQYNIHPGRIALIPLGTLTESYAPPTAEDDLAVRKKYHLPEAFMFYPAMMWEHKNHLRLLDAMEQLRRDKGLRLHLVCTGHRHGFWAKIDERVRALQLQDQVHFVGLVSRLELQSIYRLSEFLIMPSLFEAESGPVCEAWQAGTPVACSNVTSLPDQLKDAGLLFDPYRVDDIARVIETLHQDPALRESLRQKGTRRLKDFSWDRTARAYRAAYRRAGRQGLSDEDKKLLNWDWLKYPAGAEC